MVAWKKWKKNIDWSSSMEFWHLVFLKIISFPFSIRKSYPNGNTNYNS
jgi:hypothetical protein